MEAMTAKAMTGKVAQGREVEQVTEHMWQETTKVVILGQKGTSRELDSEKRERQGRDHPKDVWRCG